VRIARITTDPEISDKNEWKHHVIDNEVREIFQGKPKIGFIEKGHVAGEDVYRALGQTQTRRYLTVIFIYKKDKSAFILSARNMTSKERKRYGKK